MTYTCFTQFGYGGITMIIMGLFWVLIIALVVWFFMRHIKSNSFSGMISNKNPLEIIKERYAKGEINKTKYEEIKKELNKR